MDARLGFQAARSVVFKSLMGVPHAAAMEPHLTLSSAAFGGAIDSASTGGKAPVVVVHDAAPCPLGAALVDAYREAFDERSGLAAFVPFDPASFFDDVQRVAAPNAAVVLIQNGAFQNALRTYRVRMRLWDLGFRVAEHGHLDTMTPTEQPAPFGPTDAVVQRYLRACALCPFECETVAQSIADSLDAEAGGVDLHSAGGSVLSYEGPLDKCLKNTGCFYGGVQAECGGPSTGTSSSRSVGGSYPFGEVISESAALSNVNGTATIFAYPNRHKRLEMATGAPGATSDTFTVTVEKGAIVDLGPGTPDEFRAMVGLVRDVEGEAVIRELGIGLNPHLSRGEAVADITAFERQFGAHFSLGKRHPLFPKPKKPQDGVIPDGRRPYDYLRRRDGKFHLDVFLAAERITSRTSGDVLVDFTATPNAHVHRNGAP